MQKKIVCLSLVATFLLSGCGSVALDDFVSISSGDSNDRLTRRAYGNGANSTPKSDYSPTKGSFSFDTKVDVDSAFSAIRYEFGFQSREELQSMGSISASTKLQDRAYHWDVHPGAYYRMGSEDLNYKNYYLAMDITIRKNGTGSKIAATFVYYGPPDGIKNQLVNKVKNAIK